MCEYCESKEKIKDSIGKKVFIKDNILKYELTFGDAFSPIHVNTSLEINFCPMCGRNLKKG